MPTPHQVSGAEENRLDQQTDSSFDFVFSKPIPTVDEVASYFRKYVFYADLKSEWSGLYEDEALKQAKLWTERQAKYHWGWIGKTPVRDILEKWISCDGRMKALRQSYKEPEELSDDEERLSPAEMVLKSDRFKTAKDMYIKINADSGRKSDIDIAGDLERDYSGLDDTGMEKLEMQFREWQHEQAKINIQWSASSLEYEKLPFD